MITGVHRYIIRLH